MRRLNLWAGLSFLVGGWAAANIGSRRRTTCHSEADASQQSVAFLHQLGCARQTIDTWHALVALVSIATRAACHFYDTVRLFVAGASAAITSTGYRSSMNEI
jgi:hypothetical protein